MTPWWTEQMSGIIGGVGGGGLGALGGCVGAAIGVCAPRGIAKPCVVGLQVAVTVAGLCALAAGVWAMVDGQPRHVHFPLVAGGGLVAGIMGALVPVTLTAYRVGTARRMAGAGDPSSAALGTGTLDPTGNSGPGALTATRSMQAMVDAWGPTGMYRRWTKAAATAALFAAGLALIGVGLCAADQLPRAWLSSLGQLAFVATLDGAVLLILVTSLGRQARGFQTALEVQRLAAEELRRG